MPDTPIADIRAAQPLELGRDAQLHWVFEFRPRNLEEKHGMSKPLSPTQGQVIGSAKG